MAAGDTVPIPGDSFEQTPTSASPDLLREMIREFAQRMMDAEVEVRCGGYGEVSTDQVNSRNGYRRREQYPERAPAKAKVAVFAAHTDTCTVRWENDHVDQPVASRSAWQVARGNAARDTGTTCR